VTERRKLMAEQQRRALQLQTVAEVSRVTQSILALDELLPQAANLVRERFNLYYAGIFMLDQSGQWAVLRAGTGEAGQQMVAAGHRLKTDDSSMIGACIVNRQARVALDVGGEAIRFSNPLLPDTRSEMALPLISRDRVIGAVTVQSDRPAAFTPDDITILQTMADQIGNAIENARLYEQSGTALQEVDALNRRLTGQAWESYTRRTSREQLIRLTDDNQAAPAPLLNMDENLSAGQISIELQADQQAATVTAPIMLRGLPIGALRVRTPDTNLNADIQIVLTSVASHVAQAVENARLLEETERGAQRERTINEINSRVRQTVNVDAILKTAVNELGQSLKAARVTAHINVADSDQSSRRFADTGDQPQPGAAGGLRGNDHD
jgi:GAF domain-containing protein